MEQPDNQLERYGSGDARAAETALKAVTQDLKSLQQGVIVQFAQDMARLQAEKVRLLEDIDRLRTQQQQLQAQNTTTLSQRQVAQQQLWAKQLAQALAAHLQDMLMQRLNQLAETRQVVGAPIPTGTLPPAPNGYGENAYKLLSSLDSTFSSTFKSLQQELNSYQSSLSSQLNRMHSMEQQGEVILEALIERLRDQLQREQLPPQDKLPYDKSEDTVIQGPTYGEPTTGTHSESQGSSYVGGSTIDRPAPPDSRSPGLTSQPLPPTRRPDVAPAPAPARPQPKQFTTFQLGLLMVAGSTLALSLHNVIVGIIGFGAKLFGQTPVTKLVTLNPGNSLFILLLRMGVVLPLMVLAVAPFIYPAVWRDLKKFLTARDRRPLYTVLGSGAFLFLSQVMIYIAIPLVGPGVAVTLLFMYPIVAVPLSWLMFGDRPSTLRWGVMAAVAGGVFLTAYPRIFPVVTSAAVKAIPIEPSGLLFAIASGVAFAFYLTFMQLGFKKLHPVPVSILQFSTIFVLSSISLWLPWTEKFRLQIIPENLPAILVGVLILGVLTLVGYLLNNFGVNFMGAAQASILASTGPVVTALLASMITPGPQSALKPIQFLGILIVTLAVAALSLERLLAQPKPAKVTR